MKWTISNILRVEVGIPPELMYLLHSLDIQNLRIILKRVPVYCCSSKEIRLHLFIKEFELVFPLRRTAFRHEDLAAEDHSEPIPFRYISVNAKTT